MALLPVLVVGLMILPHFVSLKSWRPQFTPSYVVSGDEPHYLVAIASVVQDGDVDVSNNYEAVHAKTSWAAGRKFFQDGRLDHQASFLIDGKPVEWGWLYQSFHDETTLKPDDRDAYGRFYPKPQTGMQPMPPGAPEYSLHQTGIGYMLAPLTFWARDSRYLETVALLGSALASIVGFFFFRKLLAHLGSEQRVVDVVSLVAFLGTSAWFYSRSLFLESFLLMTVCGAYYLVISRQLAFVAGVFVGCAIQLKAYYLLAFVPLGIDMLIRRDWKQLLLFCVAPAISGVLFLLQNKLCYGGYLTGPQAFLHGDFLEGAKGLIFSRQFGLFYACPIAIVPLLCWPTFIRRFPRESILLGSAFLINYLLIAEYSLWRGGHCYGPRYLTPFIPFLFSALVVRPEWLRLRSWRGLMFWGIAGASIFFNALAVFYYERFWASLPFTRAYVLLKSWVM
jgi:hypothetical protein